MNTKIKLKYYIALPTFIAIMMVLLLRCNISAAEGDVPYLKNGTFSPVTGIVPSEDPDDGTLYYVKDGYYSSYTGMAQMADGSDDLWYYVEGGVCLSATGVVSGTEDDDTRYYVKDGIYSSATGTAERADGIDDTRYYVEGGIHVIADGITYEADGSADDTHYVENGIEKNAIGLAQMMDGINDTDKYYIKDGKCDRTAIGLAQSVKPAKDSNWYYVRHGKYDPDVSGIVKGKADGSDNKGYFVQKGVFNSKSVGLAPLASGSGNLYYVKNGVQNPAYTGYAPKADGTNNGTLYYVYNGEFITDANGGGTAADPASKAPLGRTVKVGWNRIGIDCYHFAADGILSRSCVVDGLTVDSSGKADGTREQLSPLHARLIAEQITNDSMSKEEKIRACFDWVVRNSRTNGHPRVPHIKNDTWIYIYAYDVFGPRGGGNCFSDAASFAYLVKACGYEVYGCNSGGHGWVEIDGNVYDPEQYKDCNKNMYNISYNHPLAAGYWGAINHSNNWMHLPVPDFK